LKDAEKGQTCISKIIGVNKSTECREFKRNTTLRGIGAKVYIASRTQKKTNLRHNEKHKRILFSFDVKNKARQKMVLERFSPELISAQLRMDGKLSVSHETIYKWIWQCKLVNRKEDV